MPYKVLITRNVPGHGEGSLVTLGELTQFYLDQVLAGNAVVIEEPVERVKREPKPRAAAKGKGSKSKAKGKGAKAKADPVPDPDPED